MPLWRLNAEYAHPFSLFLNSGWLVRLSCSASNSSPKQTDSNWLLYCLKLHWPDLTLNPLECQVSALNCHSISPAPVCCDLSPIPNTQFTMSCTDLHTTHNLHPPQRPCSETVHVCVCLRVSLHSPGRSYLPASVSRVLEFTILHHILWNYISFEKHFLLILKTVILKKTSILNFCLQCIPFPVLWINSCCVLCLH